MMIGVPKEIKTRETRVSVTPSGVKKLTEAGHSVLVEENAGLLSGYSNQDYLDAGAKIESDVATIWETADMIVKVKEPLESEYPFFREGLTLFTYLHLASVPPLTKALCETKMTAIGYETVRTSDGQLPLLQPMSEVAGRVATQIGTFFLHKNQGGKGLLLGGVTGTRRGLVTVIGGGVVGLNAAEVAAGLRAETVVLEINDDTIEHINKTYNGAIKAVKSTPQSIAEYAQKSDLLVGAVLVAGDRAPHLVSADTVSKMEPGSVIVDVAIDQGGCIETSRPTSHEVPTYTEHHVLHYCVPNMPALTPRTSTEALTAATERHVIELANKGIDEALANDDALALGLQAKNGKVVHDVVARLFPQYT
jgi:alanine dehydrogenase